MTDCSEYYIRSWHAMYFVTSNNNWTNGLLSLSPISISFKSNDLGIENTDRNPFVIYLKFSQISNICKAMSSFVFPAIKVSQINGEIHWFSSLENRNEAYLMISHFSQLNLCQNVLSPSSASMSAPLVAKQKTKIGTEMLRSIHDSQATLQRGAVSLVEQGSQLRNAAVKMEEIHEDLSVAERIAKGIDSWFGRWKLPPAVKTEELILVRDNDIPDVWDIEVLCTKIIGSKYGCQSINVFRTSADGLTILDMKQKILQHFKWSDVSLIKVVSPWEVIVTQSFIGQPDLSYGIISSSLPGVLSKFNRHVGRKIEYMNPPEAYHAQHYEPNWDKPSILRSQPQPRCSYQSSPIDQDGDTEIMGQALKQGNSISDAEYSELTSTLENLKSLALDIQLEQNDQLTTIDHLTQSVTKANDRVKAVNKIIKKK